MAADLSSKCSVPMRKSGASCLHFKQLVRRSAAGKAPHAVRADSVYGAGISYSTAPYPGKCGHLGVEAHESAGERMAAEPAWDSGRRRTEFAKTLAVFPGLASQN